MDRINWKGYLLEFFTVVMGILLAFGLNNWNENRKERVNAQQYLQGIKQEIQLNLEEITEKLVYHQNLQKELIHNPASVGLSLQLTRLKNYAWRAAQSSALQKYVEKDLYLKLLEIYELQQGLMEHNQSANNLMAHLNVVGPYYLVKAIEDENEKVAFYQKSKQGWINVFSDAIYYESILKELYTEILNEL